MDWPAQHRFFWRNRKWVRIGLELREYPNMGRGHPTKHKLYEQWLRITPAEVRTEATGRVETDQAPRSLAA